MNAAKKIVAMLFVAGSFSLSAVQPAWQCDWSCQKKHVAIEHASVETLIINFVEKAYLENVHTKLPVELVRTYLRIKKGEQVHADDLRVSAKFLKTVVGVFQR